MRIHARPAVIDFQSGAPTQFLVSVVGIAPHKTYFIEQHLGFVDLSENAPAMVGEFFRHELLQQAFQQAVEKHGAAKAQILAQQNQLEINVPPIPGVTVYGEWKNPRYGNPERHRKLHSFKSRDEHKSQVSA